MDGIERDVLRAILEEQERIMTNLKAAAYAGQSPATDVLANFKRNAERLGLSKYQVWAVYFNKHIDAINNGIAGDPARPKDKSEGMFGRILDARVYLTILACLLDEDNLLEGNYVDEKEGGRDGARI